MEDSQGSASFVGRGAALVFGETGASGGDLWRRRIVPVDSVGDKQVIRSSLFFVVCVGV